MNPKELADFDQNSKVITDNLPPLWYSIYSRCVEVGFTSDQSMELVKTFITNTKGD